MWRERKRKRAGACVVGCSACVCIVPSPSAAAHKTTQDLSSRRRDVALGIPAYRRNRGTNEEKEKEDHTMCRCRAARVESFSSKRIRTTTSGVSFRCVCNSLYLLPPLFFQLSPVFDLGVEDSLSPVGSAHASPPFFQFPNPSLLEPKFAFVFACLRGGEICSTLSFPNREKCSTLPYSPHKAFANVSSNGVRRLGRYGQVRNKKPTSETTYWARADGHGGFEDEGNTGMRVPWFRLCALCARGGPVFRRVVRR